MHTFADLAKALNRSTVYVSGLQSRFELPMLDGAGYTGIAARIRTMFGKIMGHAIQHDNSGVGHNWRNISACELHEDIREEIAAEIIDGKKSTCERYVATNGECYRW